MKIIRVNNRLASEERETVLVYSSVDKLWHMDTTVPKHCNKAKKQLRPAAFAADFAALRPHRAASTHSSA